MIDKLVILIVFYLGYLFLLWRTGKKQTTKRYFNKKETRYYFPNFSEMGAYAQNQDIIILHKGLLKPKYRKLKLYVLDHERGHRQINMQSIKGAKLGYVQAKHDICDVRNRPIDIKDLMNDFNKEYIIPYEGVHVKGLDEHIYSVVTFALSLYYWVGDNVRVLLKKVI